MILATVYFDTTDPDGFLAAIGQTESSFRIRRASAASSCSVESRTRIASSSRPIGTRSTTIRLGNKQT